jgi:hypothetical protein
VFEGECQRVHGIVFTSDTQLVLVVSASRTVNQYTLCLLSLDGDVLQMEWYRLDMT